MATRTTDPINKPGTGSALSPAPSALSPAPSAPSPAPSVPLAEAHEPLASGVAAAYGPTENTRAYGGDLGRELSARTILFHQAVAERMGLSVTDHKCLDIAGRASMEGPLTAGRLAELTGLTTGAITGVLDRLEKAGFLRREKDPTDRRQVLIQVLPERVAGYGEIFQPFAQAWDELCSRYTDAEMARLRDYFQTALDLLQRETERVRGMEPARKARSEEAKELSAPFAKETSGYLEFPRGSTNTRLRAEIGPFLYRGRFVGAIPQITAHDGRVVIEYGASAFRVISWRRSASELAINATIPWHIVIRGGLAKFEGDLRALVLRGLEISGGAADVWLKLPPPKETVTLRISKGVSQVTLLRPAGVPARLAVKGGASGLTIDTLHLGAVGGETRWESPDFAQATDRYDIEVLQGASGLTVGTLPPVIYPTRDE